MFKKVNKSENTSNKLAKKMNKISYDEHFTRATDSVDVMKNQKFTDIGDGISKRKDENEIDKLTK
ncbi:hypothetical protein I5677_04860 [Mobilitalea sibirica]|uniref:DUF4025 domain-containing protein n=1 Tax=Mobilitalea sibirica TaxID=1462919 RepID=A0A8J7HAR3_9FIRM|nr:hypothetical protein [Mobilitalea sibirica]MBH1940226.1 hypothetical protein [Mobilitalea sibirica]